MPKYKVLLPSQSVKPGEIVELTEELAASINAGEEKPRVVRIDEPAAEQPAIETPPAVEPAEPAPEPAPEPEPPTAPTE